MTSRRSKPDPAEVDARILEVVTARRRVLFSALAQELPSFTWQALLSSLNRLRVGCQVQMVAQQWDYEILHLTVPCPSPEAGDDRAHEAACALVARPS